MNPNLSLLQPYPFEKLRQLKEGTHPPHDKKHIALSIGEPQHSAPSFVLDCLRENLDTVTRYPATKGTNELREAISQWATKRFQLKQNSLTAEQHILPVNGTREALFAITQAVLDSSKNGKAVVMPNPFYQIYEGAALIAGGNPVFLTCDQNTGFQPKFDSVPTSTWRDCQILFICTPGNPTGAVLSLAQMQRLIDLADEHDFVIASDECYSELYHVESTPPAGLLQACAAMGRDSFERCIVFHSLSKRSNLPGLRSGFVAGDKHILKEFLLYRTYHGCAMSPFSQLASIAAWQDEQHVIDNRTLYRQKFSAVLDILKDSLDVELPQAGFYLWPKTPIDDQNFARQLYAEENVTVLPGSFLARESDNNNPGKCRVRMALVAPQEECVEAAHRIADFVKRLS